MGVLIVLCDVSGWWSIISFVLWLVHNVHCAVVGVHQVCCRELWSVSMGHYGTIPGVAGMLLHVILIICTYSSARYHSASISADPSLSCLSLAPSCPDTVSKILTKHIWQSDRLPVVLHLPHMWTKFLSTMATNDTLKIRFLGSSPKGCGKKPVTQPITFELQFKPTTPLDALKEMVHVGFKLKKMICHIIDLSWWSDILKSHLIQLGRIL